MIHPDTELRLISKEIGLGPVATKFIPKGTIAWVLDRFDIIMSPAEVEALAPPYAEIASRYSYVDPTGSSILCWDHARYMNHHCDPAVRGVTPQFQITVRDVHPGEELTCEYAECNIDFLECRCGSKKCRGPIKGEDLVRFGAAWDREVVSALAKSREVPQPLWRYILDPEPIKGVIEGKIAPMPMRDFFHAASAAAVAAGKNGNGSH
ncbi:MAG: SET domain-containing protein [Planctomycetota bacterium]